MKPEDKVLERLSDLIKQGESLRLGDHRGKVVNSGQYQECRGWITASRNMLRHLFPDGDSPYAEHVEAAYAEAENADWEWICGTVGEIAATLRNLRADLTSGLTSSITDRARAETFDNFLDHARVYLANERKNEAGVIVGVVFEDAVRRISTKHGMEDSGQKLDQIISDLVRDGIISPVMAKRARVAAHVRTKATHAQWDEFQVGDVEATISVTDELVLANLDGQV